MKINKKNELKGSGRGKKIENEVIVELKKDTEVINTLDSSNCFNCGKVVEQVSGRKLKKFCSDSCRRKYWTKNQFNINRKSAVEHQCSICGEKYIDYARNNRKYCSRGCYIKGRYGG